MSTRGQNVLVERGDGTETRVVNGGYQTVDWAIPWWSSGQCMIVNNNGTRIWIINHDGEGCLKTSTDEAKTWERRDTTEKNGQEFNLIIEDSGVHFVQPRYRSGVNTKPGLYG